MKRHRFSPKEWEAKADLVVTLRGQNQTWASIAEKVDVSIPTVFKMAKTKGLPIGSRSDEDRELVMAGDTVAFVHEGDVRHGYVEKWTIGQYEHWRRLFVSLDDGTSLEMTEQRARIVKRSVHYPQRYNRRGEPLNATLVMAKIWAMSNDEINRVVTDLVSDLDISSMSDDEVNRKVAGLVQTLKEL